MRRYHFGFRILTLTVLAASATWPAFVQAAGWTDSLELETVGGIVNPGVLVGFNPQPEPPRYLVPLEVDSSDSRQVRMTIPDVAVSKGGAEILLAFPEQFALDAGGKPVGDAFSMQLIGNFAGAQTVNQVDLTMRTGSGGAPAPGSWVMFNPQPEPPPGLVGLGFRFQFDSNSPATLMLQMSNVHGKPLGFELIPAADFTGDRTVDKRDLAVWRNQFGVGSRGDATRDGITGGDDFVRWQRMFASAATVAAPEPSTLALAALSIAMVGGPLVRRRRAVTSSR